MLNIGGELSFILDDIEYNSKKELLEKLREYRNSLKNYSKDEQEKLYPILSVSIQQVFYEPEWELLRYREFCKFRRNYEQNKSVN